MRLVDLWHRPILNSKVKIMGVRAIYLNNLLRGLAASMVSIFFPVYVYLWGSQIGGFKSGISMLILSVLIERVLIVLLALKLGGLVYKIGFRYSILISCFLFCLWFVLPAIFSQSFWLIVVLSVLASLQILMYWLSRLSIISMDGEQKKFGEEVSFLSLIDQVSLILGPFVGGVLVTVFGFKVLFAAASFVCLLSAVPIFFVKNHEIKDGISLAGFKDWLGNKKQRHLRIAFWGQGIANVVDAFFWPLYVFIFVGSFALLGTITSIAFATSCIAIYFAGKIFDQKRAMGGDGDEKEYTIATLVLSLIAFLRPLGRSLLGVFGFDMLFRNSMPFWVIGYESYLFTAGKKVRSALEFFTYREMIYSLSIAVGLIILLVFVNMSYFWWVVFGLGSVGTLLTLGMKKES